MRPPSNHCSGRCATGRSARPIVSVNLKWLCRCTETDFDPASSRKITFCRAYHALLALFKVSSNSLLNRRILMNKLQELMSPYMSLLHAHVVELLQGWEKDGIQDDGLWSPVIHMLSKSFAVDDGGTSSFLFLSPLLIHGPCSNHICSILARQSSQASDRTADISNRAPACF